MTATPAVGAAVGALVTCVAVRAAVTALLPRWQHRGSLRPVWQARRSRLAIVVAAIVVLTFAIAPAVTPVAAAVGVLVPRAHGRWRAGRERRAADAELPDVLESVARALRAGASLAQAVADAPVPACAALRDEWVRLRAAVPVAGVRGAVDTVWRGATTAGRELVGAALRLAADVGGPQARALDLAAATLRQRLALADEVRAQSAQARASAVVVAVAPVAFALLAAATDPRYVPFLVRTVPGACLLYLGLALDAAGLAWMTRLIRTSEGRGRGSRGSRGSTTGRGGGVP